MLWDITGIIVAFSVIMLLFSLFVTAINQCLQHFLRLRGRNLRNGLRDLIAAQTKIKKEAACSGQLKQADSLEVFI